MNETSKVVRLRQPEEIDDPLTAILRAGARRLLEQAIEAEVEAFLASMRCVSACNVGFLKVLCGRSTRVFSRGFRIRRDTGPALEGDRSRPGRTSRV